MGKYSQLCSTEVVTNAKQNQLPLGNKTKVNAKVTKRMKLAKIIKEKSLTATLKAMPIGEEQVISSKLWTVGSVRKRACELKKDGYLFRVSNNRVADVFVTRLQ